jgi:hypothetical protein
MPFRTAALIALSLLLTSACAKRDPVAPEANDAAAAEAVPAANRAAAREAESVVLPPPAEGSMPPGPIPAQLRGRWGLTPADCTTTKGDAKGLIVIGADQIRFYESVARPLPGHSSTADSMTADFAFTGEGQTWTRHESIGVRRDELTRTESRPAETFVYVRCR